MRGQIILPLEDYVGKAIKEIRMVAKNHEICLRFSGGKDSVVMKWLCEQAGIPFQARFSRTSVDPPEALSFIHKYHPDVIEENPKISMFQLIIKKGFPPTRMCRYCCSEYKERNTCPRGEQVMTTTGVRRSESKNRRNRSRWETCKLDRGVEFYHPIIDWTDEMIWTVIDDNHIPYCPTYDEGFPRLGCVGCPMTSSKRMKKEFEHWPLYERAYLWSFERMLEGRTFDKWKNKYDVMEWYIYGVQERYKELEVESEKYHQMQLLEYQEYRLRNVELYKGDYYENLPAEEDQFYHSVEQAKDILLDGGSIFTRFI